MIAEDGTFKPSNFLKALADVRGSNIDVINISAGKYHNNCRGRCRICEAVEAVTREGSVVIAGAGNRTEERSLDVFCPAQSSESIAVGMSETLCTASPRKNPSPPVGMGDARPPGAYWVDMEAESMFHPDGSYCSYRSCSPFHECNDNRQTVYWNGNVDWNDYIPEIVAPGHKPAIDTQNGSAHIEPGTSYSAAVVSGGVATVLSEILPNSFSPQRIKRGVETSSRDLDCGMVGKFDMKQLLNILS